MTLSVTSSYLADGIWLTGNLHAHSTVSDGQRSPQEVIDAYAALGHDFLMISDHDTLCPYDGLDSRGMILIPGVEISRGGTHVLHVNASRVVEPNPDRQKVIDDINADGGLAVIAHPNWQSHFDHCSMAKLLRWRGYHSVEIVNGATAMAPGNHLADQKWDQLLTEDRPVFGFGTDDSHHEEAIPGVSETGLAWNVVLAREKSLEAIVEALRMGSFYVSTGVTVDSIEVGADVVTVRAAGAERIIVIGECSRRLAQVDGNELSYKVTTGTGDFIRIECFGRGEARAWLQPFWIAGGPGERRRKLAATIALAGKLVDRPVEMTGRLDDPLWATAQAATDFSALAGGQRALRQTRVRCLCDGRRLYFGFECDEPDPPAMRCDVRANGEYRIYRDDSVEIHIAPREDATAYLHIIANSAGFYCSSMEGLEADGGPVDVKTDVAADRWTAEVAFELEQLRSVASPGGWDIAALLAPEARWIVNICRSRFAGDAEVSSLIYVGKTFHRPARFGKLAFTR